VDTAQLVEAARFIRELILILEKERVC